VINIGQILTEWENSAPAKVQIIAQRFVSKANTGIRYLFGRNEHSLILSQTFDIDGFIDDFAPAGSVWHGKPVIKGENIPKNSYVINCSMSISPISVANRCKKLGLRNYISYADLYRTFPNKVPLPAFVADTRSDSKKNQAKYNEIRRSLADTESVRVFDSLLRYRLTGDYRFMRSFYVNIKGQYFEEFLGLGKDEAFVDAGGFDGDTTIEFCKRYPEYKKVYLFEPVKENIEKAKVRLSGKRNIAYIQKGISDKEGRLYFDPGSGPASSIIKSGSFKIDVTTLDNQIKSKVTFIKMDIEGHELKALKGAKRHILKDHPKLAISVYHHASDLWRIFDYVNDLRKDYKIYMRHYTEGWSETVMIFVPIH